MTRLKQLPLLFLIPVLLLSSCNAVSQPAAAKPTIQTTTLPTKQATILPTEMNVVLPKAAPAKAAADVTPISFVDALGRKVTVNTPALRIVSLAPAVTETLFAIGAGGQVVGRTEYCDYPEEAKKLPTIGGFASDTISVESIIALEPDLVIGGSIYQSDIIKALEKAGIPVFVSQPANVAEIINAINLLGKITGHTKEAEDLFEKMQARLDEVARLVSSIPQDKRPTVFYEVWHEPLMTASNKAVVGELINLAGGVNVFADLDAEYPTISAEQLIELDPQFIIGPSSHGDQMTAEIIGGRAGWQNLTAVKNKSIYIVDGNIVSRSGPRVIDALNFFVETLHPEFKK
jgi:iron complex transport system substrate-binding protein